MFIVKIAVKSDPFQVRQIRFLGKDIVLSDGTDCPSLTADPMEAIEFFTEIEATDAAVDACYALRYESNHRNHYSYSVHEVT